MFVVRGWHLLVVALHAALNSAPLLSSAPLPSTLPSTRYAENKYVHTPVRANLCDACHTSAAEPKGLKASPAMLCTGCHKDLVPRLGDNRSIHAPVRGDCVACHDPHASDLKHLLKQPAPQLCLSCHKNIKEPLRSDKTIHGAATQEGSCSNCHVAHFSKLPKLQKQTQPQQCLSCHDRPLKAGDGRTITDMAALLKDNPEQHGPVRLGYCTACHQPHASPNAYLLLAPYPPEFYARFDLDLYKLCFNCHSPELVLKPEAGGYTGFADGNKNLHWLHVNQERGRTCRACHEVHASESAFHIRKSVPYGPGGWQMELKYQRAPRGGSCSPGCHGQKAYDHGNRPRAVPAVALLPKGQALLGGQTTRPSTAPTNNAAAGKGSYAVPAPPFSQGVFPCTGCHDPTRAVNTQRRVLTKAHVDIKLRHDEEHRWCLDCHNADNRDVLRGASGAPIAFAESYRLCGQCHGTQYKDWKAGVHGKRSGQWNGRREYLLCVHCHNPHSPKFKPVAPLPPPVQRQPAK